MLYVSTFLLLLLLFLFSNCHEKKMVKYVEGNIVLHINSEFDSKKKKNPNFSLFELSF